jgi:DNA/RNA-binding domain of Phe-tRNA-synthetase-like protein
MGLITGLITLPLAPVRGVVWVVEKVAEAAEAEMYDERKIHRQLNELEIALEMGEIDDEQFVAAEEELLDRLEIARARQRALLEEKE